MSDYQQELFLDKLPSEVLYNIFDYLAPRDLYFGVRPVCKRFAFLLLRDTYFKVRFQKKFIAPGVEYPLISHLGLADESTWRSGKEISWTDIAVRTSVRESLFGFRSQNYVHKVHGPPHTASVDAVHLFPNNNMFVTGARDKMLCLWNIGGSLASYISGAHDGWIWDIKGYDQDSFFTCGWDTTIKHWRLTNSIQPIQSFPADRAMCLSTEPGLLAAGLPNGKAILLDPRIGSSSEFRECKLHRGAVTGLQLWKNQVVSVGEDRKMSIFDIRNNKILVQRHVNCVLKTCPRSIAIYCGLLHIGDSRGFLNIFDMTDDLKPVLCSRVGKDRALNAMYPSLDCIIIGTADAGIRFIIPSSPVRILGELFIPGEVTSIDVKKNTIVAGCTNGSQCVHVFNPRL